MLAFCLLSLFKGLRQINQNSTHQGRIIPSHRVLALGQALLGVLTSRDLSGRRERGRRLGLARWKANERTSATATALQEMVVAQGLGDADRQTPRDEKGDRGAGAPVGRDHAPYVG